MACLTSLENVFYAIEILKTLGEKNVVCNGMTNAIYELNDHWSVSISRNGTEYSCSVTNDCQPHSFTKMSEATEDECRIINDIIEMAVSSIKCLKTPLFKSHPAYGA